MLLQTNSYIVPKEKKAEHARLLRRFRQTLAKLGCDHFEVYEQVSSNWSTDGGGRYVQIMRFRDRRHQQEIQAAERTDPAAQALIEEFCQLINFPYQQQQGLFAVGFYTSALPSAPMRVRTDNAEPEIDALGAATEELDVPPVPPTRSVSASVIGGGSVVTRAAGAAMVSQLLAAEVAPESVVHPVNDANRAQELSVAGSEPEPTAVAEMPLAPADANAGQIDLPIDPETILLDEPEELLAEAEPESAEAVSAFDLDEDDLAIDASAPLELVPGASIDLDEPLQQEALPASTERLGEPGLVGDEATQLEEPVQTPTLESIFEEEERAAGATAEGSAVSPSVFSTGPLPPAIPSRGSDVEHEISLPSEVEASAEEADEAELDEFGLDAIDEPRGEQLAEEATEQVEESVAGGEVHSKPLPSQGLMSEAQSDAETDGQLDELEGLLDLDGLKDPEEQTSDATPEDILSEHSEFSSKLGGGTDSELDGKTSGTLDDDAALALLSEPATPIDADALQLEIEDVLPDGAEPISPPSTAMEITPIKAPAHELYPLDTETTEGSAVMDEDTALDALSDSTPLDPGFGSVLNAISDADEQAGTERHWSDSLEEASDKPNHK